MKFFYDKSIGQKSGINGVQAVRYRKISAETSSTVFNEVIMTVTSSK